MERPDGGRREERGRKGEHGHEGDERKLTVRPLEAGEYRSGPATRGWGGVGRTRNSGGLGQWGGLAGGWRSLGDVGAVLQALAIGLRCRGARSVDDGGGEDGRR